MDASDMPHVPNMTPELWQRILALPDERQRRVLTECIARGEEIPEFAWRPLPPAPPEALSEIASLAEELRPLAEAQGISLADLIASIPPGEDRSAAEHAGEQSQAAESVTRKRPWYKRWN